MHLPHLLPRLLLRLAFLSACLLAPVSGAHAATAGNTGTGTTGYPSFGMRRVNKITLSNSLYKSLYCAVVDETNGYAYFTSAGAIDPGWIVKVDIKGATPVELGAAHTAGPGSGELNLLGGLMDADAGFAYFGTTGTPAKIIKFSLGAGNSAPAYVGSIQLASGENFAGGAVLDKSDPQHHYAYFCCGTSPGRIVKIDLNTFTEVSSLTLPSGAGEDALRRAVADPANNCAYFATNTTATNPRVVKIGFTAGSAAPSRIGSVQLDSSPRRIGAAVIDATAGYAYFGSYDGAVVPAKVYKIKLNGTGVPTFLWERALSGVERELCSAVIDPVGGYAYFGEDHTYPGRIYKVSLGAGDAQPVELGYLPLVGGSNANPADGQNVTNVPSSLYGEVFLQSAVPQLGKGFAYFGADSGPGQIVKVALGHQGAIKATKISLATTSFVTDVRFFAQAAVGNARLAIYDNASPKNLLWQSASVVNNGGWLSASASLTLGAGTYWLAWQVDNAADVPGYIAGSAGDGWTLERDYGSFPASTGGEQSTAETWAIYLDYFTAPIEAWRFIRFGTNANSGAAANNADPDGNGVTNLLAYGSGIEPNTSSRAGLPACALDANGHLRFTFYRPLSATDVSYHVEVSGDLTAAWAQGSTYSASGDTASNANTTQISRTTLNGMETIVVEDNFTTAPRFIRLRITQP